MKWIPDATGRFRYRPFYSDEELDAECEIFAANVLRSRHGAVQFPLSTDDLTVLIEREAEELELYADLSCISVDSGALGGTESQRSSTDLRAHPAQQGYALDRKES